MSGSLFAMLARWSDRLRQRAERRRLEPAHAAGREGEDVAHRFLERQGYRIVARNWMPPGQTCEIDLVALDGEQVVFVEVKSRRGSGFGDPERNLDAIKRVALRRAARWYLKIHAIEENRARFDLVSVLLESPPAVRHVIAYAGF